jgi:hypothetical protein
MPSDGSSLPDYSRLVRAWPAGDGWDAAVEAQAGVLSQGNVLLHSSNGLLWHRLEAAPLPKGASSGDDINAHAGVASPNGQRLVWQVRDVLDQVKSALSTSADGQTWTRVPAFDGAGAFVHLGLGPEGAASGPWLIIGTVFNGESLPVRSWFSEDLTTWAGGRVSSSGFLSFGSSTLERWAGGYVLLGQRTGGEDELPVTWVSADGTTWSEVAGPDPALADAPVFLAAGPSGLIGVGSADRGSQVWLGNLPS